MSDLQNILSEKSKANIIICLKRNIFLKAELKNKLRFLAYNYLEREKREKGRENRDRSQTPFNKPCFMGMTLEA